MRCLMKIKIPMEKFNELVRKGTVGQVMSQILEESKPECVYFCEMDGFRTAILVVNLEKASQMPALAEPWYLKFNAQCEFHPAMTPQDLSEAGLDKIGQKWAA